MDRVKRKHLGELMIRDATLIAHARTGIGMSRHRHRDDLTPGEGRHIDKTIALMDEVLERIRVITERTGR